MSRPEHSRIVRGLFSFPTQSWWCFLFFFFFSKYLYCRLTMVTVMYPKIVSLLLVLVISEISDRQLQRLIHMFSTRKLSTVIYA